MSSIVFIISPHFAKKAIHVSIRVIACTVVSKAVFPAVIVFSNGRAHSEWAFAVPANAVRDRRAEFIHPSFAVRAFKGGSYVGPNPYPNTTTVAALNSANTVRAHTVNINNVTHTLSSVGGAVRDTVTAWMSSVGGASYSCRHFPLKSSPAFLG